MRFLLVVPRAGAGAAPPVADADETVLAARSSSNPQLLVQRWVDLDPRLGAVQDGIVIELAARCTIGDREYYAIEATAPVRRGQDVVELETALSAAARAYIATVDRVDEPELPWVARYALLDAGEREPQHWMAEGGAKRTLTEAAAISGRRGASIEVGWGNGLIRGWSSLAHDTRYQLVRGIIDAQHIWHDASMVVASNEDVFARVIAAQGRPKRREVRELLRDSSHIEITSSAHQLLFDDLIQNVQGVRRVAAESLLEAWGYERFVSRMLDRVRDAGAQVGNLRTRIDSRYHAAVQGTLMVLGILAVVDLMLSFIGTAYSGDVDHLPGRDDGLFALLRYADADLLLSGAVVVTAILAVLLIRRR